MRAGIAGTRGVATKGFNLSKVARVTMLHNKRIAFVARVFGKSENREKEGGTTLH